jgi:hypothetical protein
MKQIALCLLLSIASCPALAEPFSLQCYIGQGVVFLTFDDVTKRVVAERPLATSLKGEIYFMDDEKIQFSIFNGEINITTQFEWNRQSGALEPGSASHPHPHCDATELRPALRMYDRIGPSGLR